MGDGENAGRENQETHANANSPLPAIGAQPAPNPDEPHAKNVQNQTGGNPQITEPWFRNPDWHMVLLTAALFAVGVVTLCIFYGQFSEMQRQTGILTQQAEDVGSDARTARRQAREQLRAMQAQVDVMKRQMEIGERASLGITSMRLEPLEVGKPAAVQFTIENDGKTVGLDSSGLLILTWTNSPIHRLKEPSTRDKEHVVYTAHTSVPGVPYVAHIETNVIMTRESIADFSSKKIWIYIYGRLEYGDIFKHRHITSHCEVSVQGTPLFQACPKGTYPSYAN